jgi:hypothetical protein
LRVADFEHDDLLIREGPANALGLNYLSRFIVTFDFPNDQVYLEKGARFEVPTQVASSGLHVVRTGGDTVIDQIDQDRPVASVRMRVGDRLLEIDGREARGLSLFEINEMLTVESKTIRLVIEDDEGPRAVSFPTVLLRQTHGDDDH